MVRDHPLFADSDDDTNGDSDDDNNKNNNKNNIENNKNKNNNEDTSTKTVTTVDDDDDDDDDPTNGVPLHVDENAQAYIHALESCGKVNQFNDIRVVERLLGGLVDRQVRFADVLTQERLADSWARVPETIKRSLDEIQFKKMTCAQDWINVTQVLDHIDPIGKCGEIMVRDIFDFLFHEYIVSLEVVGQSEWIDVKMVLLINGVTHTYLIEVKTPHITQRMSSVCPDEFIKIADRQLDDSGTPIVWGANTAPKEVYECLCHVLCGVDYYRLQRKEGAILVNLIVLDDSMELRIYTKMTPGQIRTARGASSSRRPFKMWDKTRKTDVTSHTCVSGGFGDLRRLLAMRGSCALLNIG